MTISINNKGILFELKAYAIDNNFKSILVNSRTGFHSVDGEQIERKINLAPGDVFTYDSIGQLNKPSILMVRAESGILLATLSVPTITANSSNYDGTSGRAGNSANYGGSPSNLAFEIDKFFFWSGSFITLTLTNPETALATVQLILIEG